MANEKANELVVPDTFPVKARGRAPSVPRLQTEEQRADRLLEIRAAAVAENTKLSYSSDLRQYQRTKRILPASEGDIMSYIADFEGILAPETIAHHLRALSKWHREYSYRDPTESESVKSVMAGVRRRNPTSVKQARPLTDQIMWMLDDHLVKAAVGCDDKDFKKRAPALAAIRDNALLQIGFFGAFRRSELVGIHVEHLNWKPEGVLIRVPISKTDQAAQGTIKAIPTGDYELCPVRALRTWLDVSGIQTGPVFRPFKRNAGIRDQALTDHSVANVLVARLEEIGVEDPKGYSGHSLRRGLATSAYLAGAAPEAIKAQGGWKSDASVSRYIETANQFNKNAGTPMLSKKRRNADEPDGEST